MTLPAEIVRQSSEEVILAVLHSRWEKGEHDNPNQCRHHGARANDGWEVSEKVSIPVIAHGGAGNFKDIYKILEANKISKQIENFEGLCSNLFLDFENLNMKNKNANLIDNLGRQTLKETMVLINNFVKNEA